VPTVAVAVLVGVLVGVADGVVEALGLGEGDSARVGLGVVAALFDDEPQPAVTTVKAPAASTIAPTTFPRPFCTP
jgi:hypothetical protein